MMNMKKFGIISAAIIGLYSSPSIIANNLPNDLDPRSFYPVSRGIVYSDGRLEHPSYVDPVFQNHCLAQNQASIDQDAYNNSWTKYAKDTAVSGLQYTGEKLWDVTSYAAQTALAWNMNYYGLDVIEEAAAYGAYGVGTLMSSPAVGSGAYYATKGTLQAARYIIPGFEGYISGALAPVTKTLIVDPVVNYGPSVVSGAFNAGVAGTQYVANGLSSLYSYWRG